MNDCIFCKIVNKEIPSEIVYETDEILAFKDINPVAPVHIVFIPKKHICCVNKIEEQDIELIGKIFIAIKEVAKKILKTNIFAVPYQITKIFRYLQRKNG